MTRWGNLRIRRASVPRSVGQPSARGAKSVVRRVIMVGSVRMPGWRYALSQEQIGAVIAYLNTVTQE